MLELSFMVKKWQSEYRHTFLKILSTFLTRYAYRNVLFNLQCLLKYWNGYNLRHVDVPQWIVVMRVYFRTFYRTSNMTIYFSFLAAVYAENCQMASDCTMETCSSGGMVECQHGVCTCGGGGGGPGGKLNYSYLDRIITRRKCIIILVYDWNNILK